jgi:hypothetical protein
MTLDAWMVLIGLVVLTALFVLGIWFGNR